MQTQQNDICSYEFLKEFYPIFPNTQVRLTSSKDHKKPYYITVKESPDSTPSYVLPPPITNLSEISPNRTYSFLLNKELIVIDIDDIQQLSAVMNILLENLNYEFSKMFIIKTPTKGYHIYFRNSKLYDYKNIIKNAFNLDKVEVFTNNCLVSCPYTNNDYKQVDVRKFKNYQEFVEIALHGDITQYFNVNSTSYLVYSINLMQYDSEHLLDAIQPRKTILVRNRPILESTSNLQEIIINRFTEGIPEGQARRLLIHQGWGRKIKLTFPNSWEDILENLLLKNIDENSEKYKDRLKDLKKYIKMFSIEKDNLVSYIKEIQINENIINNEELKEEVLVLIKKYMPRCRKTEDYCNLIVFMLAVREFSNQEVFYLGIPTIKDYCKFKNDIDYSNIGKMLCTIAINYSNKQDSPYLPIFEVIYKGKQGGFGNATQYSLNSNFTYLYDEFINMNYNKSSNELQ